MKILFIFVTTDKAYNIIFIVEKKHILMIIFILLKNKHKFTLKYII